MIFNIFSTRRTKEKAAGFIPPLEVDIKLIVSYTAITGFIYLEELLEEDSDFPDKLCEETCLMTFAGAIISGS